MSRIIYDLMKTKPRRQKVNFQDFKTSIIISIPKFWLCLKLQKTAIIKWLFSAIWSKHKSKFSKNVSNSSLFWLSSLWIDKNLQTFFQILNSRLMVSWKYLTLIYFIIGIILIEECSRKTYNVHFIDEKVNF